MLKRKLKLWRLQSRRLKIRTKHSKTKLNLLNKNLISSRMTSRRESRSTLKKTQLPITSNRGKCKKGLPQINQRLLRLKPYLIRITLQLLFPLFPPLSSNFSNLP